MLEPRGSHAALPPQPLWVWDRPVDVDRAWSNDGPQPKAHVCECEPRASWMIIRQTAMTAARRAAVCLCVPPVQREPPPKALYPPVPLFFFFSTISSSLVEAASARGPPKGAWQRRAHVGAAVAAGPHDSIRQSGGEKGVHGQKKIIDRSIVILLGRGGQSKAHTRARTHTSTDSIDPFPTPTPPSHGQGTPVKGRLLAWGPADAERGTSSSSLDREEGGLDQASQ